ncbi:transporter substrate-binding domain-containing protein [Uliginosibacterium sp. H3]|uniref:Transporter substrate-binding domain-containing protein n=1 Tax=Uliginosibacterium silvisoli TaxID=3114758 RepID=A0ABU6K0T1_9RHOO|nr:transporter substrate-binding domain-containing protein [Uliginosibacterium sp. H3]
MNTRIALAAIISAVSLVATSSAYAQAALDTITKSKKVRIAIPTDYPPYGTIGTDLKPQGLDIDFANYIGSKLGATVELVPVTAANRIAYLQSGKADVVVSTLGKTPEREKVIDYTYSYSPFFIAIFAKKDVTIKSFADLAGKTVATTRGATADAELSKVMPANTEVKRFEDHVGASSAFLSGQTQVIATSAPEMATVIQRNPQANIEMKLVLKNSPNYIGVNKGEEKLRARINEIIAEAKTNGEIDRLAKKWLGREAGELPL